MTDDLRKRMFNELEQKFLFDEAHAAASRYADEAMDRRVFPSPEALEDLSAFDEDCRPARATRCRCLQQLDRYGSPATVAQIGGRYFGLVNGSVLPVTLAVRWLTDFWDQNTPLYLSSPVASRLEEITEGWLRKLFYLPDSCVAGYVSGSSTAILCGLAAARQRQFERLDWDFNRRGFDGAPRLRVIASRQAHGTVSKAIALLGFGLDNGSSGSTPTNRAGYAPTRCRHWTIPASSCCRPATSTVAPSMISRRSVQKRKRPGPGYTSTAPSACGRPPASRWIT